MNISPLDCMQWVIDALKIKYSSQLPHKISTKLNEGKIFFNTMPCHIPDLNRFGVKEVSRFPGREPAISGEILLYDTLIGEPLALIDGDWITAMRTGAVAACAINYLQNETAEQYSFIGLGNTARATMLCLLSSNPKKKYKVKVMAYKDQAELFISRFKNYSNVFFEIVNTRKDLISYADVVVSCVTVAENNIGEDDWFKKGVLVVPVHTRGFQNCDLFFDKVFADDKGHVEGFKYFNRFKKFDEFSNVVQQKTTGRENNEERILAYNIGIALHDVYFASQIYQRSHNAPQLFLRKKLPKFWV